MSIISKIRLSTIIFLSFESFFVSRLGVLPRLLFSSCSVFFFFLIQIFTIEVGWVRTLDLYSNSSDYVLIRLLLVGYFPIVIVLLYFENIFNLYFDFILKR